MEKLGRLSAKWESGKKGAAAVGWDKVGGTSYGTYQIASRTGTFDKFLAWLVQQGEEGEQISMDLQCCSADGGVDGKVANTWRRLAGEGKIQFYEHEFIKATHFTVALDRIGDLNNELKEMVEKHTALQEVLWSTSVQHGPKSAATIFVSAFNKVGNDPKKVISEIYAIRGTKFKSSTPPVQAAVRKRFTEEEINAIALLS